MLLVFAYLAGSIPFGLILTRAAGLGDIRAIGSGNIGATNVLRKGKKSIAFLTLLLDLLKGWCAVYVAKHYGIELWAAVLAVLGHMFPVWLKFRGGKGVAAYAGVLFGLSVPLGMQALLGWIAFLLIFGYSSLAALLVTVLVPFSVWLWHYDGLLGTTIFLSVLIWAKHYDNIQRLLKGEEPKVGKRGKKSEQKSKRS
jgi:glycerol-3-phosphate acyltransferase PlsY